MITLESIIKKLGFDPREKAPVEIEDDWTVESTLFMFYQSTN